MVADGHVQLIRARADRRPQARCRTPRRDPGSKARTDMVRGTRRRTRRDAVRLARGASKLPLDRVAFLSHDELREDPRAGTAWAAHVLDPEASARPWRRSPFPSTTARAERLDGAAPSTATGREPGGVPARSRSRQES